MSFIFKRTVEGGVTPHIEEFLQSNVSITLGQVLDFASGYVSNGTPTSHVTNGIVGVADETVDNSGGSAGDTSMAVVVNPSAIYEIDTTGTPTQAQMGTDVTIDTAATADEDDPVTGETGIVRLLKLKDAANSKVYGMLNFHAPGITT